MKFLRHRCTEGDYHHLKHTKIDRSPAVAKQRSLGSLSNSNSPSSSSRLLQHQQQRFQQGNAIAMTSPSLNGGSRSSSPRRRQSKSVDSELPPHGVTTGNVDYVSSNRSPTGNTSAIKREPGNAVQQLLQPTVIRSSSSAATMGNYKTMRTPVGFSDFGAAATCESNSCHATTAAITMTHSSTRTTSSAATGSRRNTLDVPEDSPETRLIHVNERLPTPSDLQCFIRPM